MDDWRLNVALVGTSFEKAEAETICEEVSAALTPVVRAVFFDFRRLKSSSIFARSELIKLQGKLAERSIRSAYLASVPRIRGMCMFVVHVAEDDLGRVFINKEKAEAWVMAKIGRREAVLGAASPAIDRLKGSEA